MNGTVIRDRILAAIQARYDDRQRAQGKPHQRLSATGDCLRKQYYAVTDTPRKEIKGSSPWEMEDGNIHEDDIVDALSWAGIEVDAKQDNGWQHEASLELSDGHIVTGHLDGYVRGNDLPPGWGVLEIKSMSFMSYARTQIEGLRRGHPEHYAQIQGYLETKDLEWGLYVAKAKDSSAVKRMISKVVNGHPKLYVEIVYRDRGAGQRVRDRHEQVRAAVHRGVPPEREFTLLPTPDEKLAKGSKAKGDWNCSWCPFVDTCYPTPMAAMRWAAEYEPRNVWGS